MKIRKDEISKMNHNTFIMYWTTNCNSLHETTFKCCFDSNRYMRDFLNSYDKFISKDYQTSEYCIIVGCQQLVDFKLIIPINNIEKMIELIWKNPEKLFIKEHENEDWYYDCLKLLFINNDSLAEIYSRYHNRD